MKNNATRTIRAEEITIDVRICAALAAKRGGEIYLAAIAPDIFMKFYNVHNILKHMKTISQKRCLECRCWPTFQSTYALAVNLRICI